jgi:hypothetical protein
MILAPGGGPALKRAFEQQAAVDPIELGSKLDPRYQGLPFRSQSGDK